MIISVPDGGFEMLLDSVAPDQKDLIFFFFYHLFITIFLNHFNMLIIMCCSSWKTKNWSMHR